MENLDKDLDAIVIAVDPEYVYVLCPFCGKVHVHGSNGAVYSADYGHRLAHCKERHSGGYYLKPNRFTRRSDGVIKAKAETILKGYLGPRW